MTLISTRRSLLAATYDALARAQIDLSRTRVGVGWLMETQEVPEIRRQHAAGARFEWVATGFGALSFFDLHAGVVADATGDITVGVHAHERSDASRVLGRVCAAPLAESYSSTVRERQLNFPTHSRGSVDWAAVSDQLVHALHDLSRIAEEMETTRC